MKIGVGELLSKMKSLRIVGNLSGNKLRGSFEALLPWDY